MRSYLQICAWLTLRWMTDEMADLITPELIGEKPNTYTYTKQMAENVIVQEGDGLPITIVRPSIVTAAWQEPIPVSSYLMVLPSYPCPGHCYNI